VAYNNTSNKSTFVKKTGADVINNNYVVDYSSLINPDDRLSMSIDDQDEIVVVRKFDESTIVDADFTSAITASEAWSAYTLPRDSDSGSPMYTIDSANKTITFSTTASDWDWTTSQSGRGAVITLPSIASGDTIYVLRKTYSLTKLVEFTSGSRINSDNLNFIVDQLLFSVQEAIDSVYNLHEWNPVLDTLSGVPSLDSSGLLRTSQLNISAEDGIQGTGKATDKIRLNLADDSMVISGEQVKVNTSDVLTSTSTTQPLSANQGKTLDEKITSIGGALVYKGTFDISSGAGTSAPSSPSTGHTYDVVGTGTHTMSNLNSLSLTAGDIIRYSGSTWVEVTQAATIRADGTIALSGDWDAGSARTIQAETVAATDSSRALATTAHVKSLDVADFNDVTDYGAGTNGHILKRISGAWVSVDPDDGTNGISIHNLKDVQDSAASTGQFLKWTGSTWEASAAGVTNLANVSAGTNDGTTDDASSVTTALNNAGIAGGSASTSSILGSTDFQGRHYGVNSSIETFTKSDFQWRHGKFNWTKSNSASDTMLKCPSETSVVTYVDTTAGSTGDLFITVNSSTNILAEDLIQIYTTSAADSSNPDVTKTRTDGSINQFELHFVDRVDGNVLWLKEPLLHSYATGTDNSRVAKKGSSTNAQQQPHDIIIEDLVFDDTLHHWSTIAHSSIAFNQATFGNSDISVTWPVNHGLTDGAKATFVDLMIDHDNTSSSWSATPEWDWLNNKTMAIDIDPATATLTANDGDAAHGLTAGQKVNIISTDGTSIDYFVSDTSDGGVAHLSAVTAGATLKATGSITATLTGGATGIAVGFNVGSGVTQNAFLVLLKAAIEHANGHNGKITVSAVPTEADGNQAITLTQAVEGDGNTSITDTLATVTKTNFTGGSTTEFEANFSGGGAGTWASGVSGTATNTGNILGIIGSSIGVHIENGYRILFKRCRFKGFAQGQVKLTGCKDVTFEDCEFDSLKWTGTAGNAVVLKQCRDIAFKGCTFRNVSHGIAYDGTGSYTSLMGLVVENCKFIGVTSGIRDINNGILWDAKVYNSEFKCVSFNSYRNYPIADTEIYATPTAVKLVGMKIDIDHCNCDGTTYWDSVAYSQAPNQSQTANYGTGSGWSTRWRSYSTQDYESRDLTGVLQPSAAYGIKIVTTGGFDLGFINSDTAWTTYTSAVKKANTCRAVNISNCNVNAWLCGIHISAEVGLGSASRNYTNGVHVLNNVIESLCNCVTVYGGQTNNAGIRNFKLNDNSIILAKTGLVSRFPGIRKLQGLCGSSAQGLVVNCTTAVEYAEGPAVPQFAHAVRFWCDIKQGYFPAVDDDARTVQNQDLEFFRNSFKMYGPSTQNTLSKENSESWDGAGLEQDLIYNSTTTSSFRCRSAAEEITSSREMEIPQTGHNIIWGRHTGGESWNQLFTESPSRIIPTVKVTRIQNTNNLIIKDNTFLNYFQGAIYHNHILQQYGSRIAGQATGWGSNARIWYASSYNPNSGMYPSIGHSMILNNIVLNRCTTHDDEDQADGSEVQYTQCEPVVSWGETDLNQGVYYRLSSILFGKGGRTETAHELGLATVTTGWNLQLAVQSSTQTPDPENLNAKNQFTGNLCYGNNYNLSETMESRVVNQSNVSIASGSNIQMST